MGIVFQIFEIIGTAAFAVSGAMEGIRREMDLFGVAMLGLVTAVGGGVLRDVIIGNTPPAAFRDPTCAVIALAASGAVFLAAWLLPQRPLGPGLKRNMELLLFWADTVGLAAFTVLGIESTLRFDGNSSAAVLLFVGVVTGVGGGILRDVLSGSIPYVFRKHIYALASIAGAAVLLLLIPLLPLEAAALCGFGTVLLLRVLAARHKWNLPRVRSGAPS